jgi:multidrug efflux pump
MQVTNFSIRHATSVWVLIVILFVAGLISYNQLPREAAPDIAIPVVIVSTAYFGVSPADIETLVTNPLEKEFKGIRDLKKMTSTSAESVSLITLEFDPEVVIEDALQKIRDKVDKAKSDLPPDAEDPDIIEINASDWPVLVANVSGKMDPVRLKELAEDVKDDIEKVPGVLRVDLAGGVEREIQVLVDPTALQYHKVSLNDIIAKLQAENINLPGGTIDVGPMKYTVRVPGEFENVQMIEDLVVKVPKGGGAPVYLRDVAQIRDGFKEPKTFSRLTTWKGEGANRVEYTETNVSLAVVKRSGENIIDIAAATKDVLKSYEARIPEGVNIVVLNDMSVNVLDQVHDLENNIISGLILVLGVLFFFMGGARNALFVAISVPLSMLITFIVLQMLSITLNMVVLFSLVLALGMLVDNAIVIVENIYRHASEGKDRVQASIDGTAEVGWAVIASTATTVAAFAPMVMWPGVTGEFMSYLPKTVIITLLASLFVALVINPTVCATLLKVDPKDMGHNEMAVPDNRLYRTYKSSLIWAVDRPWTVLFMSCVALVASAMLFGAQELGVEFFPQTTPERFNVNVELPDGTRIEETDKLLAELEKPLDGTPDLVEAWIVDAGVKGGNGGMSAGGSAPHYGKISVDLVSSQHQTSSPFEFMERLRKVYSNIPGASIILAKESSGPPAGAPVNIEIIGDDLLVMAGVARQVKDRLRVIPGIIDLQDNIELSRPEVHLVVDRTRAAIVEVDTRGIAQTIRTAINGTIATVYREGDEEFDITVRLHEDQRRTIEDLSRLTVVNKDGIHIPITEVASIQPKGGAGSIRHKDQDRIVTISANAAQGFLAAKLLAKVQEDLKTLKMPAGYEIRYTGESEDQKEAGDFLAMALLAALFFIVLILVTEFNSIIQPLIIMGSVVLSLIGVFLSLVMFQLPFGVIMTGIGVISLAGVVVNNAIVLIDYANQLRERGMELREAAITAGVVRFRPVLLTASTTVLGLLPLVAGVSIDFVNLNIVFGGRSVEMWGPMANVVSAGLGVSTLLILIVVPAAYVMAESLSTRTQNFLKGGAAASAAAAILVMLVPFALQAQEIPSPTETTPTFSTPDSIEKTDLFAGSQLDISEFKIEASRTLTLAESRVLVRQNSLDVAGLRTQITIADAMVKQAWSTVFPTLSANANYIVNQEEIVADFGAPAGSPAIVIQPKTTWNWALSASLRANFRALSLLPQARLQQELAKNNIEVVAQQLDLAVLQTYYTLLTTRRVMEVGKERLVSAETLLKATLARQEAGTVTEFEVTRARLQEVQARKDIEAARLSFLNIRGTLAHMLQTPPDFDVTDTGVVTDNVDLATIQEAASINRPDVAQAKLQQTLADEQVREIYFQYLPILSATFQLADQKGTALSPSEVRWTLSFGASWTIWDGGLREAKLDIQEANLLASQIQSRKTSTQITADIDTAWNQYLSSLTQLESGKTQVELAETATQQANAAYRYGATTQLDVINAENQLAIARIAVLQDRLAVELAAERLKSLAKVVD